MNIHVKEMGIYSFIIFIAVMLSLVVQESIDTASFEAPGSRFTGEDAIWLIENSYLKINDGAKIDGISTPFREYINSR